MADMRAEVDACEAMRGVTVQVDVRIRRSGLMALRVRVAMLLFRLAGIVLGCGMEVTDEEQD